MYNIDVIAELRDNEAVPYVTMGVREGLSRCGRRFGNLELRPGFDQASEIETFVRRLQMKARECAGERVNQRLPLLYFSVFNVPVGQGMESKSASFLLTILLQDQRLVARSCDLILELPSDYDMYVATGCAAVARLWPVYEAGPREVREGTSIIEHMVSGVRDAVALLEPETSRERRLRAN